MAKAFARRINTSLADVQGTAVGKALEQALLSFSGETAESHSRVIILITDGENHEDDALEVARQAAEAGIRIYTIGIGTPEGAPIQINGEFIKDEKGDMVVSKLDEKLLQQIAEITGGAYVRSTKQSIGLDEIVRSINDMEQTEFSTVRFEEFNEQYPYLLAVALVLLLVEFGRGAAAMRGRDAGALVTGRPDCRKGPCRKASGPQKRALNRGSGRRPPRHSQGYPDGRLRPQTAAALTKMPNGRLRRHGKRP